MRKVFGIGETILDIIFKNDQPTAAVPGGSTFNAVVSLGRVGVPVAFYSETGDDRVGRTIIRFMEENGVDAHGITVPKGSKSPVSLAFLNERNDAEYIFYKDHPHDQLEFDLPDVQPDDVVLFGSYYAVNPVIRQQVGGFLHHAHERGAILYYDVNFRRSHAAEAVKLTATFLENFELADVVRGSTEDFDNLFGLTDVDAIYRQKTSFYCPAFICTNGARPIEVRTPALSAHFAVSPVQTVSTIGAGDNFNAGFIYGLLRDGIGKADLPNLDEAAWTRLVACGQQFSANVCASVNNSVDKDFKPSVSDGAIQ